MPGIKKNLEVSLSVPRVYHRNHCSSLANYLFPVLTSHFLFFWLFSNRSCSEFVYIENKNSCFFRKVYSSLCSSHILDKWDITLEITKFWRTFAWKSQYLSCDTLLTFGTMVTHAGECHLLVPFWVWARVAFVLGLAEKSKLPFLLFRRLLSIEFMW